MISVIIPLYNKEKQIVHTLRSVLKQTYQDFEVVIVNDGSTDCSVAEVEKVGDSRIRLVHQKNGGVSSARNKGIEEAKYELLAFLDADDEWKPEYLETQYNLFEKYPMCSVYACNYEFKNVEGKRASTIIRKLPFVGQEGILSNYFEVACCSHPPLWTSAILVKKEAILSIGGFPVGVISGEDLLTWAKLAVYFQIAYSKQVCAQFNIEGYALAEKPKRIPVEPDIVGQELYTLFSVTHTPYLRKYMSHWHKMRSSIYMRLNMSRKSISEARIGIKYNPFNYKLYIYILLNLLPDICRSF